MRILLISAIHLAILLGCAPVTPSSGDSLPPGSIIVPLNNPSFVADQQGRLNGWGAVEHAQGNSYTFVADHVGAYSAPTSLRIRRHGNEDFGLVRQVVKIPQDLRGKAITARLFGYLRADAVSEPGGALMLQARRADNSIITYSDMVNQRLTGNQGWTRHSIELKVPSDTYDLIVGVMLEGSGSLWADDLTLTLIEK